MLMISKNNRSVAKMINCLLYTASSQKYVTKMKQISVNNVSVATMV